MGRKSLRQFALLGLYTETPLHCGAESGVGFVDLPIQRERHTDYPLIPGSTIKGVLRDEVDKEHVDRFFGPEDSTAPGSIAFGDAIIVALPVRSTGAPFHWVSCCFALERVSRLFGMRWTLPSNLPRGRALAATGDNRLLLEEIAVTTMADASLFGTSGAVSQVMSLLPPADRHFEHTRKIFPERFVVVHDDDFGELVKTSTEVVTRIKLNSQGTTSVIEGDRGNMFVEELVPSDALFVAALRGDVAFLDVCGIRDMHTVRLGGDETVGRGVTHLTVVQRPEDER